MTKDTDTRTVLTKLERLGKPGTAKIYARHGVREPSFGVSYADVGRLVKELGTNHALALSLWKTGNHDARVIATRIADPEKLSARDFERFLADASNYIVTDALSALCARMPNALAIAKRLITKKPEHTAAAGYNVIVILALDGKLPERDARTVIARIQKLIHRAPNRTRHSMNGALIAIGGRLEPLRAQARAAAHAIGKVEVDHGQTGCKTPDAAAYIERMLAHEMKRGRIRGARLRSKKSART